MTKILAVDDGSPSMQKVSTYAHECAGYLFVIIEDSQKKVSVEENNKLGMTSASLYMCRMNERFLAQSPDQFNHQPFKPFDSEERLCTLHSALN